jgi:hypothetical protein
VREIKSVHPDPEGPEDTDEQAQGHGSTIAVQKFIVENQCEGAEGNDCKYSEGALNPEKLTIKWF